jgi:hypothetical protein
LNDPLPTNAEGTIMFDKSIAWTMSAIAVWTVVGVWKMMEVFAAVDVAKVIGN